MTEAHQDRDRVGDDGARPSDAPSSPTRSVNLIALSRAVSFSGGNAAFIALLFVLYQETNSAGLVAFGAFATFVVPALASPFAGWLGDRFDRRKVMVASELAGAFCFLLSAAVSSAPAELLVLRVLASLAASPLMPATAAALPSVVRSDEELPAANAKLAAAGIAGGVVGPLVAAGLIAISGAGSVFLFNTVTFLISAAFLISIDADFRPGHDGKEKQQIFRELAAGFNYLGHHPVLRPVTLAYGIVFIGVGLTAPAEVALSADFGAGALGFASLTCVFALGGIAGTLFAKRGLLQLSIEPVAILTAASGVLAIGFLVVGVAPVFVAVLAGMTVVGMADAVWMVAHENLVQRSTPDEIRSRVFAGSEAVYQGGVAVGTIAAGGLIAGFGASVAFQVGAGASLLACLLLGLTVTVIAKTSPEEKAAGRRGLTPASPTAAVLGSPTGEQIPPGHLAADQRTA